MSLPLVSTCGCQPCAYKLRSVAGILPGGGDPTNMIAWVNGYNLSGLAWGALYCGSFSDPSHTTPDSIVTYEQPTGSGVGQPFNATIVGVFNEGDGDPYCTTGDYAQPTVSRTQFYLPFPTAYYVLAFGPDNIPDNSCANSGGNYLAAGCIYPQQADSNYPMIVELPIPDTTLDTGDGGTVIVYGYYLGIIQSGKVYGDFNIGVNFTFLPDLNFTLAEIEGGGISGLGSNWSASIANPCYAGPDDPFTDSEPP